jgi:hypothetical protein
LDKNKITCSNSILSVEKMVSWKYVWSGHNKMMSLGNIFSKLWNALLSSRVFVFFVCLQYLVHIVSDSSSLLRFLSWPSNIKVNCCNEPELQVRLVGRMLNKVDRVTDVAFILDDGTGRIDVNRWYAVSVSFYS